MKKHLIFLLALMLPVFLANCNGGGSGGLINDHDVNLQTVEISEGTLVPLYSQEFTDYRCEVENSVESITITVEAADAGATIDINGSDYEDYLAQEDTALSVGENLVEIIVSAPDGTIDKTYTIEITRLAGPSDNATLAGLLLSAGTLSPAFSQDMTAYATEVFNDVSSITVTPITAGAGATVTVNGQPVASGTASPSIDLAPGTNHITVLVTAQDTATTKAYVVEATRLDASSDNANLSALSLSIPTPSWMFSGDTTSYFAEADHDVSSITVTPTVAGAGATVTVNGQPVTSGSASQSIDLPFIINDITVVVTAQNHTTTKTYTIEVIRLAEPVAQLPRTGQTTLYVQPLSIYGTGDDGFAQMGTAWPKPRFTDNVDWTITDELTGLMWTVEAETPGPVVCDYGGTKTWEEALEHIACLNGEEYLGYNDWRLPNKIELRSLINHEKEDNATWLNQQGFINVYPERYWSSTSKAVNAGSAWVVLMQRGALHARLKTGLPFYVWPVRAGQNGVIRLPKTGQAISYKAGDDGDLQEGISWPTPRFTVVDGVVMDNLTGLMWTKDAETPGNEACGFSEKTTWINAVAHITCLNEQKHLGFSDWRLPNINELESLVHAGQPNNAVWLQSQGFINVHSLWFWSSTTSAASDLSGTMAWSSKANSGELLYQLNKDNIAFNYVWPVRAGQ